MSCEPPMYGRDDAGQSSTMATHQPPDTTSAAPRDDRARRARLPQPARRGQQVHAGEAGQDQEGLEHLGQEGEPDERAGGDEPPACAPASSARTRA